MAETRKLQRIGGTTLYVSLPKRWIKRMNLKQGDKVTVASQPDDSIYIYPTTKTESVREILLEINTENSKQSLKRGITAAYVDGFDTFRLKAEEGFTDEQQDTIREIVDQLFGLELIEITGNAITIQCLLKQDLPITKNMQRIHNVILSMFSETISALNTQNINRVKGLSRRRHDVKRLSLVTNRLLRSLIIFPSSVETREISLIDCVDYLRILHIIAEIADNVNRISESVPALGEHPLPKPILDPLCQVSLSIKELYDHSIQALLTGDILLANRVLDRKENLENLWGMCRQAGEQAEISCLVLSYAYLLIDNLKQIQQYADEIAEIAIDRAEAEM